MSKASLVIVESPAKASTIKKFLGKNYEVMASIGHVMDLPKNELGVDISNGFAPKYIVSKGKQKVLLKLKKAAKEASEVLLALDMDREGEAIAWHLQNFLSPVQNNIKRIIFNEITKNAILEAVASPHQVDMNKVEAQQARRILDRLVGYQISPILWQIFYYGLSAGRVQTVGLRLVLEREDEIQAFVPEEYWSIEADLLSPSGHPFKAKLTHHRGKKIELGGKEDVDPILQSLKQEQFRVDTVTKKKKKRNPQPPYITSTLQRDAARRLRFSAKKIMVIAQQLYEGIDLGKKERVGLITYMRTDSVRISDQATQSTRNFIQEAFGKEYVPSKTRTYRQSKRAQDAHEAIRPSDVARNPESLKPHLTKDQLALYDLIWRRFVASQMESCHYDTTEVGIAAGECTFKASGRVMTFPGFLKVYDEKLDTDEGELPALSPGDILSVQSLDGFQHFTEPPPRYTESTLIKELEDRGIGRPSTYANIVSIIQDREYVEKDNGRFAPTTLGRQVWITLKGFFPKVFDTSFTAMMEEELDRVEGGGYEWQKVVMDFYEPFEKSLNQIADKKDRIKSSLQEETDIACEKCGRKLIKKWGKNGQFLACPAYPECKFSRPLEEQAPAHYLESPCPVCGSRMLLKRGRFGRFAACERYPECKHTESYRIGVDCPAKGCSGKVVEKVTRRGKIFYGCSRYPKCDFASWDKPVAQSCPHCDNPYLVEKTSKKRGTYFQCPSCKEEITPE
jgi:DNA topoisomerase-1